MADPIADRMTQEERAQWEAHKAALNMHHKAAHEIYIAAAKRPRNESNGA